jgi:MFS family permease
MAAVPLTGSFWSLLVVASVIGIGNGLGSGTMMTLGADLSPSHAREEFLGIWWLIGDVGGISGPVVVGGVAELFVLQTAIWVVSGVGLLAAATFLFLVPETLRKGHGPTAPR